MFNRFGMKFENTVTIVTDYLITVHTLTKLKTTLDIESRVSV